MSCMQVDGTHKGSEIDETSKGDLPSFANELQEETELNDVEWHKRSLKFLELLSRKLSEMEDEFLIPEGKSDRMLERIDELTALQQLVQEEEETTLELASWLRDVAEGKAVHHSWIGQLLDELMNFATFRFDLQLMVCSFASLCESGVPDNSEGALRIFDECFLQHELPTSDCFRTDQNVSAASSFSSRNPTAATCMSTTQNSHQPSKNILNASDKAQDEEHTLLSGRSNHQWPYTATVGDILAGTKYPQTRATALTLQVRFRRILARRKCRQTRAAALTVQAHFRGFLARRKYRQTRAAALTVQAHHRGFLARRKYRQTRAAALTVQAYFRGFLARRMYRQTRAAALTLQAHYRGCLARRKYRQTRAAALTLQAHYRGYLARRKYRQTRAAALTVQAHYRGFLVRRKYRQTRAAALTVQAHYRGFLARRKYRQTRAAALTVQAHYRGFLARRKCRQTRAAALTVQAHYRGFLARRKHRQTRAAALTVQAHHRGFLARRKHRQTRAAALTVQARFRRKTTNFETFPPSSQSPAVESKFVTSSSSLQSKPRDDMLLIKALVPTSSQHPVWLKGKSSYSSGRSAKKNRQAWRVKAQRRIEAMRENGYSDSSSQETKQTRKNVSTPSKVSQSEGNAGLRHMERPRTAKDLSTTFHDSSTRVLMGRNSARGATATQAVDNESSCLHYCHRDGALEVIKRQLRSTGPQCCMKHDLLSGVVTGHTLDTLRGRLPIVDGSQHHSDFGCLSPGATGSGSQSHSELDIHSAQALKRNLVKADSPRIIEGATNDRVVDEQQSSCRDTERSVPEDIVMPVQRDSRLVATYQDLIANEGSDLLHAGDYERMLQVLKHGEAPTELPLHIHVALKFGCGIAYYKLSKRKEALKFLKECEAISVRANRTGDVALSNLYMGDIEATQQNSELAAGHYTRALEHYSRDNVAADFRMVFPTISAMYAKLAASLRNASRMIEAVQAYRNAIASADSKRDKLAAHTSLGNLFQSLGENSSAVTEYEQSIKLAQELEDRVSLGWAHGNIGNAYLGLYQKDKALHHLETSLEQTVMYEPVPQAISRAYNNLGTAYQALNDLEKAEYYFSLALGQAIYGNDIPGQARVYGNIGNVLMIKKIYERAIPHYSEVLNLSRDRSTISTSYHNRGCAYYEWAESKKKALLERSSTSQGNVTCYYHGTDFTETDAEHRPPVLPDSILKFYKQARRDLERVVKYHEETLNHIKGSTKGLSLSVSLFESNSWTFHRLQDCLVNLGLYEEALVIAEQSRARSLGELLLKKRMGLMQECPLAAPLSIEQIKEIVKSQSSVVVYFSYTGARLLVWVLVPTSDRDNVAVNMIEIPLEDDEFDGKSLDYHLRYSLTETLVEWSFEMYTSLDYTSESNKPVEKLYELVAKPLQQILSRLKVAESACIQEVHEVIVVPDSYTSLIPLTCLLNPETRAFLGDNYTFPIMPSLLTMGILDQLPATRISVPNDSQNMCIVGNPTIPPFMYNHERWQLGKLPHAAREAEWVAHILKTSPILAEQATKNSILMRIMNSKVIHLATHGSASAGFLAFAGMGTSRSSSEAVDAKTVLVYPEDVEHVNVSTALVVLSSYDSGRGIIKADGIIGMARAFILAGAHAVLTTLWRVPDESASVFMKFFYQYLVDGFTSSLALQKAILSIRCFTKYSQYIHWSGYQLIGREIEFENHSLSSASAQLMNARVGSNSVFPRLEIVKKLETAFIKGARAPTDVQILRGAPGINPSEALIDFIHSFHSYFQGGIFWLNGLTPQFITAGLEHVRLELKQQLHEVHHSEAKPVLLVLDCIESMPTCSTTEAMNKFLRHHSTHIVVLSKYYTSPDSLAKEIDQQLVRGCVVHEMKPLSMIHTTQRIVHSVLSKHHLAPSNEDQSAVEALAEFTSGSPILVNLTAALLKTQLEDSLTSASKSEVLQTLTESLCWNGAEKTNIPSSSHVTTRGAKVREIFSQAVTANPSMPITSQEDLYLTDTVYDTWYSACALIDRCNLSPEERLLVNCISIFGCSPVPMSIVTRLSTMIGKATRKSHIVGSLATKLQALQLLKTYPTPVVFHPSLVTRCEAEEAEYVYVPTLISRAIWKDESFLTDTDKVFALATTYKAFESLQHSTNIEGTVIRGLICCLVEAYSEHFHLVGRQCYMEVFRLKVRLFTANTKFVSVSTSGDNTTQTLAFHLSGQNGMYRVCVLCKWFV